MTMERSTHLQTTPRLELPSPSSSFIVKPFVWIRLAKHALHVVLLICSLQLSLSTTRAQPPEDQGQGPALSPQESMAKFQIAKGLEWTQLLTEPTVRQPLMTTFDSRGRLWVVQYLQYPEPAGIKALSRDNFWRIVYDQMPKPPGHGGTPGADKITIHEDRDGDGRYEHETVFVDGLNIVSSVVPTEDGAWVLNPPYLLFFRDSNGDSRADGPPEVHLEGFGLEDTHSVVNSLCMGPDGWLYAAQGSTVTAAVRKYGSTDPPMKSLGQAIWRYHPRTHEYELFAEGGGNAFGVAFDELGQVFSGYNGGDTRGFHYMQGGYYLKGFTKHGSLSNPYTFGYLKPMKHDPVQRFTHTMLMTDGTSLQSMRSSSMLTVDPLHGKLFHTKLNSVGSTYSTIDEETSVASEDKWFRPVAIQDGPDGAAYVCDWYDFQVAHIYAHVGKMDRDHGRVYRLAPIQNTTEVPVWNTKLARGKDAESLQYLLQTLRHPYRWQRWQARRLIVEHPLRENVRSDLIAMLKLDDDRSIDALWTLQQCGWISDTIPSVAADSLNGVSPSSELSNSNRDREIIDPSILFRSQRPEIRSWTVRLVADDRSLARTTREALQKLAAIESNPQVLCQIACSIRRLPTQDALPILRSLLDRDLPVDDLFLPLLAWWAVEQHADQGPAMLLGLLEEDSLWQHSLTRSVIAPNLIQRWSRRGTLQEMGWVASLLSRIDALQGETRTEAGRFANEGFERAYEGKSLVGVPDSVLDGLSLLVNLRLPFGFDAEMPKWSSKRTKFCWIAKPRPLFALNWPRSSEKSPKRNRSRLCWTCSSGLTTRRPYALRRFMLWQLTIIQKLLIES